MALETPETAQFSIFSQKTYGSEVKKKMAKIEVYVPWMFADKWTLSMLEFIEAQKGDHGQEFHFCGAQGDCRTFPGKIKNLKELVKKIGSDTDQWKGKRFEVKVTEDQKYFILTPL